MKILDLLYTSYFCMGLTCIEIKREIWISFSSFIRSGSVLPKEKCSALDLSSWWGFEWFEEHSYISVCSCV